MRTIFHDIIIIAIVAIVCFAVSYLCYLVFGIKEQPDNLITQEYCDTLWQGRISEKEADLQKCEGEKAVCENGLKRIEKELKLLGK